MGEGSILEEVCDGEQDEDQPEIQRLFEETRFLFVVYQKTNRITQLKSVFFWSMPREDIEAYVRPVWKQTFDAISEGTLPNLPKSSFNQVCHVRPHARNKKVTLPSPHNGEQVKKSFWLDRRYIQTQIGAKP
jgi:DNA mismatch repair protein MutH